MIRKQGLSAIAASVGLAVALTLASLPAAAKDKAKVAFIGPLTGGVAANGIGARNSAELAVKLRNADPKAKYEYELVVLDDECKPNVAVQVATKAGADRSVIAAAAHYCSAAAIAAVETYNRLGLPMVVWGAVLPDITYRNKYPEVHRVNGTMINQNEVAAKFMTGLGFKKWVVIHDTTDYGKGHNEYFTKYAKENGGQIVGTFGVTADQQDFTAELTQAKALNPEVIYFGGLTPIGIRIRSQMDKLGLSAVFQGTSGIKSDAYIQALGPLAEGSLSFIEGAPIEKLPGGKFFQEQYDKAGYKEPPEAYGAFAFVAMQLILDTIEQVGPDRKKVTDALGKVANYDSVIGPVTFDDHGQNTVPLISKYVAQDGKWVIWEDSEYASRQAQAEEVTQMPSERSRRMATVRSHALRLHVTGIAIRHRSENGVEIALQYLINGLMLGIMYGLVAVGFTLFFGVLDVIKFSHGDVLTVGVFTGFATYLALKAAQVSSPLLQLIIVSIVAMAAMAALGAVIARYLVLPLSSAPALNTLLITLMLGTVLREGVRLVFPDGSNPKPFPALLPTTAYTFGHFTLRLDSLMLLAAGVAMIVAVHLLINRTKLGLAIRAVAQDGETARTMGINFTFVVLTTFAIGSGVAAFAGVMNGLYYNEINFSMGLLLGVFGFSAAVVGGLGNIYGAILGGFLFAGLQTIGAVALPFASAYKDVFALAVIIAIMAWRPTGLIAEKSSERV